MQVNYCKATEHRFYACYRHLFLFSILVVLNFTPMQGFCITPFQDSSLFRFQETESILIRFKVNPHRLTQTERKILRKELKFQRGKTKKGEGGNTGVQIFLLVLLTLAILWGSFLFIGLLAYAGGTPTFLLVLLGLISIAGIVLLLIGGSRRIKKRKQLNAEGNKS